MSVNQTADLIDPLDAAFAALYEVDLTRLGREELLDSVRRFERFRNRLATLDHRIVAELDARGVAQEHNVADTGKFLSQLLRLSPGEAKARVVASGCLGERRSLTGQALPSAFPVVAASQAHGVISAAHAEVITTTIDSLPAAGAQQYGSFVERTLVEQAAHCHPAALRTAARRIADRLDPDGTLADERDHDRLRQVTLVRNRDGSGTLSGRLTPSCTEKWLSVLDPLAAPVAADVHGSRDTRSPAQRIHDALDDVAARLLRSGALPDCGGTPTTVLITVTAAQLAHRALVGNGCDPPDSGGGPAGLAKTGHGALIGLDAGLRIADEAYVMTVVHDRSGRVVQQQTQSRIATRQQRLALAARDHGCSFPGCDAPPAWSQAHHILEWSRGGATSLDNLTLVCGYHHRNFERAGWGCQLIDGVPHWSPPAFIDPAKTPRRNTAHGVLAVMAGG